MVIFLSGVSAQFKECRDALASDLRAVGAQVKVQEDFQQQGGSLLEKLEQYIASCDRVIALVGTAYGSEPGDEERRRFGCRKSFTQWECHFASGGRMDGSSAVPKPTYVYFANPEYLGAHPVRESPECAALQQCFCEELRLSGKDWSAFGSRDELRALVLRDGFRLAGAEPKPAPPPQNLPYCSLGRLFKGREGFLDQLRRTLLEGEPVAPAGGTPGPVAVLDGLGGVGKTRLAVEFAWRHQDRFSALLFVAADTPTNLRSNLASLTGPMVLNLGQQDEAGDDLKIAAVYRWMADHPGWFLIVDNVDTEAAAEAVMKQLARLRGGRVLITSKIRNWRAGVERLDLDVLSDGDSRDFLLERTERDRVRRTDDPQEAQALARELDGLALALEQAGAYICKRVMSFADYRAKLRTTATALLSWFDRQAMDCPKSVALTWRASLDQVSADARRLLHVLAWLSPEPIPLWLLETDADRADERLDALSELETYSLVRRRETGRTVSLHRLVQQITRSDQTPAGAAPDGAAPPALLEAMNLLDRRCAEDPKDEGAWAVWTALEPHAAAAVAYSSAWKHPAPAARLAHNLGHFLETRTLYAEAEKHLLLAKALHEGAGGTPAERACDLARLSKVHRFMGRLEEAEREARAALAIDEAQTPQDPAAVGRDLSALGIVLFEQKRHAERLPIYQRALNLNIRAYGPEDRRVGENLNDVASAMQDVGTLDEAERLYRQAIAIGERMPSDDHEPGIWVNNLGTLMSELGRKGEAEECYRKAVRRFEASRVPNHPQYAFSLLNLASTLVGRGCMEEARPLLELAYRIRLHQLGPEREETVDAAVALLNVLMAEMDIPAILPVAGTLVTTAGTPVNAIPPHQLAMLLVHLRRTLDAQGGPPGLQADCDRLLAMTLLATPLDNEGRVVLMTNDVAKAFERREDWSEAERIYREALKRSPADPVLQGNLAFLLGFVKGDWAAADALYRETLSHHAEDAVNRVNFAGVCMARGDWSQAETQLQSGRRLIDGEEDPYAARLVLLEALLARKRGRAPAPPLAALKRLLEGGVGLAGNSIARLVALVVEEGGDGDRAFYGRIEESLRSPAARERLKADPRWAAVI